MLANKVTGSAWQLMQIIDSRVADAGEAQTLTGENLPASQATAANPVGDRFVVREEPSMATR
jgi:hypothetical protein